MAPSDWPRKPSFVGSRVGVTGIVCAASCAGEAVGVGAVGEHAHELRGVDDVLLAVAAAGEQVAPD